MRAITLIFGLLFVGQALAAKESCSAVTAMKGFSSTKFLGRWFEIKRDSSVDKVESLEGTCTYLNLTSGAAKDIAVIFSTVTKKGKAVNLNAAVTTTSAGVLKFTLTAGKISLDLNYTILGTDYTNYAVASACATVPKVGDIQIVWIYSRQRTLSSANLNKALAVLKSNNLDSSKLVDVTQSGCSN